MLATVAAFFALFGLRGVLFGYMLPRLLVYPTYSWIALLAEHRWFARSSAAGRAREYECGRPTDYTGFFGWLVTSFISPAADHFHLAHSLYPHVRWNHLGEVDRILKQSVPAYASHASLGLLAKAGERPSALSELRDRMTDTSHPDLADWALRLTVPSRIAPPAEGAAPRAEAGGSSALLLPSDATRGANTAPRPATRSS
jgi:fatty acid desaturase